MGNNSNAQKPYFFSFANSILANVKNDQIQEEDKDTNSDNKLNEKHLDYTKMTRINIKFQNPLTKSIFFI